MLAAFGIVDMDALLDGMISMANDANAIHEHNRNKKVRRWVHEDGWGIAYQEQGRWVIHKSALSITKDPGVDHFRSLKPSVVILHARKRTAGGKTLDDVQPYHFNNIVFCHNGTIRGKIRHSGRFVPKGTTDSERLFYAILDAFKGDPVVVQTVLQKLDIRTGSNVILSTPKKTYITIYFRKHPGYYRMMMGTGKQGVVISSEALSTPNGVSWNQLDNGDALTIDHATQNVVIENRMAFQKAKSI